MNLLLIGAGRRNFLIQCFKDAMPPESQVWACDVSNDSAAMQEADRTFLMRNPESTGFAERILEKCQENSITAVLPMCDTVCLAMAKACSLFNKEGISVIISPPHVIELCMDKLRALVFAEAIGFDVPRTYTDLQVVHKLLEKGKLFFPLVVKPRFGTGSNGLRIVYSPEELKFQFDFLKNNPVRGTYTAARADQNSMLVQEFLMGQEYGLDVVNDLTGKYVCTFGRKKLAMRAGETDRVMTSTHPKLVNAGKVIGESLYHVGNLDCDVFDRGNAKLTMLEMNPRFGGGYPFSHSAGANIPAAIVAWVNGLQPSPDCFTIEHDKFLAKCDRIVGYRTFLLKRQEEQRAALLAIRSEKKSKMSFSALKAT